MAKTLGELKPGESGYISAVGGNNPHVKRRLVDMGITPLTQIRVTKIAPMGDPIEVRLRSYSLSLRREDALSIWLFDEAEAKAALEQERLARQKHKEQAASILQSHEAINDKPAHERAARLTDWAISDRQDRVEIPGAKSEPQKYKPQRAHMPRRGCGAGCRNCPAHCYRGAFKEDAQAKAPVRAIHTHEENRPVKLALAGNPNSGKTTLFNAMTGAREYVGNWPGVTVEKKEGKLKAHGHDITLVDLPGIYSLSPYSQEEVVARNFIIGEQPDAIINIVDGTNLERNLYLTLQLMELERPMILALNMMDEVEKSGDILNARQLALELGIPVVPISARTGAGVNDLLRHCEDILALAHEEWHNGIHLEPDDVFDAYTHATHHRIGEIIDANAKVANLPRHWAEMKVLEGDALVLSALKLNAGQQKQIDEICRQYAGEDSRFDGATRVADSRYRYISHVCSMVLQKKRGMEESSLSDRIDKVLTSKYFALPLFLLIMLLIFAVTFGTVGQWMSEQVAIFINDAIAPLLERWLTSVGSPGWLISLLCDGVIGGVGGVLEFLPQIALLFLCLSFLEDSGYLSRTAFIMDKPLRRFGLSGKSFIPMLMGFGCTVPATMGARTIEDEHHRRMTILLLPFLSCSAKLPVYGLIAGTFFTKYRGLIVFSLYFLGILMGSLTGLLFKKTLFQGQGAPFVMEMPPYRWPTLRNTLFHVQERVIHFLEKAGTIILLMSVILWFLQSFDFRLQMVENAEYSLLGVLGGLLAPALKPLGFGTWQAAVALLTGVFAKEAVVAALALFYGFSTSAGEAAVRASLSGTFTPLAAYSFLVFVLLYVPCMAAVATMRRELNSRKWTAFMIAYQVGVAYVVAMLVYQVGMLLGIG